MAKSKVEYWLTEDGLLLIGAWARDGLTDEQIAHNMGISTTTYYRWQNEHWEIRESLKKNKEIVDIEVENALLKRAKGFTYTETTSELMTDSETGEKKMVVVKEVEKTVLPDTTAAIFWLKNRKPQEWRDTKDINVDGTLNANVNDMTDAELDERIAKLKSKIGFSYE